MIKLCLRNILLQTKRKLTTFSFPFSYSSIFIRAQDLVSPLSLKKNILNNELCDLIDYVSALDLKIVTPFHLQKCYDQLKNDLVINEHKISWFFFLFLIYAKTQNREYIYQFSKDKADLNTLLSHFESNIYLTLKKEQKMNENYFYDECFNYFKALLCNLVLENKSDIDNSSEFENLRKNALLSIKYISNHKNPSKIKTTSTILCMIFISEIQQLMNTYNNPKLDSLYLKNLFLQIKKHITLQKHFFHCVLDDLEHLNSCLTKTSNFNLSDISGENTFFLTPLGLKYFFCMMQESPFYFSRVKNIFSELSLILPFSYFLKHAIIFSFFEDKIIRQDYSHLIFYCLKNLMKDNEDLRLETLQKLTLMASRKKFYIQNFNSMKDFWIDALNLFKKREPFVSSFYLNNLCFSFSKVCYVFPEMKDIFENRLKRMEKITNFCSEQILFLTAGFNLGYFNRRNMEIIIKNFHTMNKIIMDVESLLGLGSLFVKMKVFDSIFWSFFFDQTQISRILQKKKLFDLFYILNNFERMFERDFNEKRRIKCQQKYSELYKDYLKVKEKPEIKELLNQHVLSFKANFPQEQCTILEAKIIKLLKERKIEHQAQFASIIFLLFFLKFI